MPLNLRAIILLFTSIAVLPAASVAHQQAPTFSVGGIDVKVPTPDGFQQIDQTSERVRDLAQVGVTPDGRLLAFYQSNDDGGRLTRGEGFRPQQWLMLQTFRLAESMYIDDERFKGIAATIEIGTPQLPDMMKSKLSGWTDQWSRSASSATETPVSLQVEGPVSMGVYDRQAHAISSVMLAPLHLTAGDRSVSFVVAGAGSVVHVSGRLLFAYAFRIVNNPSDIDWVRSTATAWVAAILGANAPAASPGDTTPRPAPAAPIRVSGDIVPPGTSTPPYGPGAVGLTLPLVLLKVDPAYTPAALRERIGGTVVLDCVVREDGKVGECRVTRSLDSRFGLDQEAIKAARQWLFVPGKKNGVPVPVLVTIELTFSPRAK